MTLYTFEPSKTIIWRDRTPDGKPKIVAQPCDCSDRIPGLEADFCRTHRTYWRDKWLEHQIRERKSQGSSFDATVMDEASSKRQSTPKTEDAVSPRIWGQEGEEKGDRLYPHPQDASRGKNQGLPEDEGTGELIRVVNVHAIAGKQLPNLIVAMQSEGHPLGNPYYREAKSDRPGCIKKFKSWLWEQYQIEDSPQRKAIEAIASLVLAGEQVNLACCCFPAQCHCDEIKALVENFVIPQRLEAEDNPLLKHTCHAVGCDREIAPKFLMCPRHWGMVPKPLQAKVYRLYRPGQEVDKKPTPEYLQVMREAIAVVQSREVAA